MTTEKKQPAKLDQARSVGEDEYQRIGATARAKKCWDEIAKSLEQHHCTLAPHWQAPVPVGTDGATLQLTATVAVIPNPVPE